MADDKGEGRMLIALNALIDGQRRTLRMVETAIERYSTTGTELTKVNRKLNASHELVLRNHSDVLHRLDTVQEATPVQRYPLCNPDGFQQCRRHQGLP